MGCGSWASCAATWCWIACVCWSSRAIWFTLRSVSPATIRFMSDARESSPVAACARSFPLSPHSARNLAEVRGAPSRVLPSLALFCGWSLELVLCCAGRGEYNFQNTKAAFHHKVLKHTFKLL